LEDLWLICGELGLQSYRICGATIVAGSVHAEKVERGAARVAGSRGNASRVALPTADKRKGFSF
jgi:hypothetical protein